MSTFIRYNLFVMTFLLILPSNIYAQQDDLKTGRKITKIVSIEDDGYRTRVHFPGGDMELDEINDTVAKIRVGRRHYEVIDKAGRYTRIQRVHNPLAEFQGHWSGFDLGLTNFFSTPFDSNLPEEDMWLDLNSGKSVSVGINLLQYSIGLQKQKNNLGVITGLGWTINNYRFDSKNIMIRDDDGYTSYVVSDRPVEKNKLVTSFLTVPVLLELQLPAGDSPRDFFISAGVFGGFRLGSHTKVVYSENGNREKEKDRDDYNLNTFKYGFMARVGYKWIKLYAKCDFSPMFESGRGPEVYPWTVGLTLIQF